MGLYANILNESLDDSPSYHDKIMSEGRDDYLSFLKKTHQKSLVSSIGRMAAAMRSASALKGALDVPAPVIPARESLTYHSPVSSYYKSALESQGRTISGLANIFSREGKSELIPSLFVSGLESKRALTADAMGKEMQTRAEHERATSALNLGRMQVVRDILDKHQARLMKSKESGAFVEASLLGTIMSSLSQIEADASNVRLQELRMKYPGMDLIGQLIGR